MTLEARSVTLGYGDRIVVDGVDLSLAPGSVTAIVGPNGCGKSTLMHALAGLLSPREGQVCLDATDIGRWSRRRLARQLAMLPQTPVAPDGMSVRRVVEHGRFAHQGLFAASTAQDHTIVQWALDEVGLSDLADRPFAHLSGGERQRGWIALALAQKPRWLLLDEPTTYLDIGHQFDVLDLVAGLNRREGIGVVMVLHDINQAAAYADRIVAMRKGAVFADGTPNDVITTDNVQNLFGISTNLVSLGQGAHMRPHCIAVPAHMSDGASPR